ncbi:MAG TPA: FAD/NAD(P)-binding protein [Gemmatimonadaceae bacterium]|nr:FAD/NAD(P)-binding protein [Gemmatimonadaceae bacterium]
MTTAVAHAPHGGPPSADDAGVPVACRVAKVARESPDCWTLTLVPEGGGARPPFAAGQFNMLYAFGVGEAPISMSGPVEDATSWIHTIRAVGSVTRALCALRRGATVGVRGPFGTPWPVDDAEGRDVILIAGGIGLAPLRPALYSLLAHRRRYGRVILLYGARTPEDLLFRKELSSWRGRFDLNVSATVDRAHDEWLGHVGVVTKLVRAARFDPGDAIAMICGPEIMMRYAAAELSERGIARDRIYVSMERSMKCGIGLCGHCQFGGDFVCADGPVFRLDAVLPRLHLREL